MSKDDDRDIRVREDGQLVGLFEKARLALEVRDGAIAILLDALDLDLLATHGRESPEERERVLSCSIRTPPMRVGCQLAAP